MSVPILGIDVYGTLIDTQAIGAELERHLPGRGAAFAAAWRQKQLEYTFRRAAMEQYRDFDVCTAAALDFVTAAFGAKLGAAEKSALLERYRRLPAFPDVLPALDGLREAGARLLAFSNGVPQSVHDVLASAGIRDLFEDIVSVDEVKSFKPDPVVYLHYVRRACGACDECWLVSANAFDVIGAVAAGMRAVWVQRDPAIPFDPWELQPTAVIPDLSRLLAAVQAPQG
ncbi:MAG TPA: haloacid dehalogenase type II [Burkholderiales bacterium]|nr:haloacid dehalogenase type II [Burkholderiales bacterium]